ncbi:hypothetical protein U1Q18_015518 [Sarracenia purpurea var. burkii]
MEKRPATAVLGQRNCRGVGDYRHNLGVLPRRHLRHDGDRRTISHQIWTPVHLTRNFGGADLRLEENKCGGAGCGFDRKL